MFKRPKPGQEPKDDGALMSIAQFMHPCTNEGYNVAVVRSIAKDFVPKFNAPVFNERGKEVGIIDEVFGPVSGHFFTIKTHPDINPRTFTEGQLFQIREGRTLSLSRFTNPPPPPQRQAKQKGQDRKQGFKDMKRSGGPQQRGGGPRDGPRYSDRRDSRRDTRDNRGSRGPNPYTFTRDGGNRDRDRQSQGSGLGSGGNNVRKNRFSQGQS